MIDEPNDCCDLLIYLLIYLFIYLFIYLLTLFNVEENKEAMELLIKNVQLLKASDRRKKNDKRFI